jgi:hypothetical protein
MYHYSLCSFVGFFAMNPLISLTEWTNVSLDIFHEVINDSLLMVTGVETNRTKFAYLGQCPV